MPKLVVKWDELHNFFQIYEITEMRDGAVYKTIPRGFAHQKDVANLDTQKYRKASISTKILQKAMAEKTVELERFEIPTIKLQSLGLGVYVVKDRESMKRIVAMDIETPDLNYAVDTAEGRVHRRNITVQDDRSDFEILADGILNSRHAPTERAKELDNLFRLALPGEYDFNEIRILGTLAWLDRNGQHDQYRAFADGIKGFGYGYLL